MGTEFLVFQKVTKGDLMNIDRSRCNLPIRIMYDSWMELLIVKLMAGKAHGWIGTLFADLPQEKVHNQCGDMFALCHMGAFRCVSDIGHEKESDVALVPMNQHRVADWPSCVFEVGVSERLSVLQSDAHFWILHSGGLTRVVILISVDTQTKIPTIERWGSVPPLYPSHVAGLVVIQPRMVQRVTIDMNRAIGAPLDVPSGLVFDMGNVPLGILPIDFSFDANDLIAFYGRFWAMLEVEDESVLQTIYCKSFKNSNSRNF